MLRKLFAFFKSADNGASQPAQSARNRPGRDKTPRLEDDVAKAAQWISTALLSSGYKADFSPESIAEVERFFCEHARDGAAVPGGLLSQDLGSRLFALGSYCGEVLRKELGGTWVTDDSDPSGEINVALKTDAGTVCWPVQRVMKRYQGSEDNLVVWAEAIRTA